MHSSPVVSKKTAHNIFQPEQNNWMKSPNSFVVFCQVRQQAFKLSIHIPQYVATSRKQTNLLGQSKEWNKNFLLFKFSQGSKQCIVQEQG